MGKKTWTQEMIIQGVVSDIADALGLDLETVQLNATIQGGLGAESIDFLDILFRSAKTFDITNWRILESDLKKIGQIIWTSLLSAEERTREEEKSTITKKEIDSLKTKFPFITIEYAKGATFQDIVTVEFYCKFIAAELGVPWTTPNIPATT